MDSNNQILLLDIEACRKRQSKLIEHLRQQSLDAAIITDPRHVNYFTAYWHVGRPLYASAALINTDGTITLFAPYEINTPTATDQIHIFESNRQGTLVDDQHCALMNEVSAHIRGLNRVGTDRPIAKGFESISVQTDIMPHLRSMRRNKDEDEVRVLEYVLAAGDAAYDKALEVLSPGMSEIDLYSIMCAAAIRYTGEPILEFGNDFQARSVGGPPRNRPVQKGEAAILDISVVARGYSGDSCRTFVIDEAPSEKLQTAHCLVMEAMAYVESTVKPGVSCRAVHENVLAMIDGKNGWRFPHHLGHGIGLAAHETPRLNRNWDDTFEAGDVFTAEPGLYHEELRGGVRVENVYRVTNAGVQCLTHYPTDLLSTPGKR